MTPPPRDPLLRSLPEAALRVDAEGRELARNEAADGFCCAEGPLDPRLLGVGLRASRGFIAWLAGKDDDVFRGRLHARRTSGVPLTLELSARRSEGGGAVCLLIESDPEGIAYQARRYFDSAFEDAPIGMALFNTDGEYVRVNEALCRLLGRSPGELLGRRDQEFTHPDDRQSDVDAAWRILRGEIHTWQCEKRFVRADGGVVWTIANLTFLRDAEGNPMSWVGQFQDITARKALEVGLREREHATRQIVETAYDAFVSFDEAGVVTDWNARAETMFGYRRDEALGGQIARLIGVDPHVDQAPVELAVVARDGRPFPAEVTVTALDGVRGRTFNAFLRDISDRKTTEEALAEAHAAAVEASRVKSEFVANMSHEIRTPLNGVIGMTDLLSGTDLTDEQRDYVDAARASGHALMAVVDDILDFSRIEAGRMELVDGPFGVRDLAEEVSLIVAAAAHTKGLELIVDVDDTLPPAVSGDRTRVQQVLANLLSNAVKFTAAGEVVLRVTRADHGDGPLRITFQVSDTGIGIPRAALGTIFESFSQADGSTTRRFGGTGLGLAISQRLVELMGGRLRAESAVDRGSRFWFTLTLRPGHATEPPTPRELPPGRALVVDDNAASRSQLARVLTGWGLPCDSAGNGGDAMELLAAGALEGRPYVLAVLDSRMPGMGGIQLAASISRSDHSPKLILLTSAGDVREPGREAGVDAFVAKPVRLRQLHDQVGRLLRPAPAPGGPPDGADGTLVRTAARGRVLVAEDNPIHRILVARLLEQRGFTVDVVADATELLARHGRGGYEAIFVDCQMPELDGYELTAEIRRREGDGPRTPVIAMTAWLHDAAERCLAAGMDDYIGKPVDATALDRAIDATLSPAPRTR